MLNNFLLLITSSAHLVLKWFTAGYLVLIMTWIWAGAS